MKGETSVYFDIELCSWVVDRFRRVHPEWAVCVKSLLPDDIEDPRCGDLSIRRMRELSLMVEEYVEEHQDEHPPPPN